MSDYISRESAEKVFSQPVTMSMCLTLEECKQKNAQRQIDLFVIRGLPAADVREVVLCRDCKYSHPLMNNCKKCSYWSAHGLVVADHDFCSHGERREES